MSIFGKDLIFVLNAMMYFNAMADRSQQQGNIMYLSAIMLKCTLCTHHTSPTAKTHTVHPPPSILHRFPYCIRFHAL